MGLLQPLIAVTVAINYKPKETAMTHPLLNAMFAHYPTILRNYFPIGSRFDSHEFIQKLTRDFQSDYIAILNHYVARPAPFMLLHRQLSTHLHTHVFKIGRRHSKNIFGDTVSNTHWERR